MSNTVTNSSAMNLSNTVRNPLKKDRHCWVNWAEYAADDVQSMKHCRTLTQEAKVAMKTAVCKHITRFSSFGRRLVG